MDTDQNENQLHCDQSTMNLAEMKDSISEIERTNNFILKRLNQQHDKRDGENLHLGKLTETLMLRLQDVERREQEQDKEMRQLVKTVTELGETVSSMCTSIDTIKSTLMKGPSGKERHRRNRGCREMPSQNQGTVEESHHSAGQLTWDSSVSDHASSTKVDEAVERADDKVEVSQQPQPSEVTDEGSERISVLGKEHAKQDSDELQGSDKTVAAESETIDQKSTSHSDNPIRNRTVDSTEVFNDKQSNVEETSDIDQHSPDESEVSAPDTGADQQVDESVEGQIVRGIISDEMWSSVVEAEANKAKDSSLPYGDGIDTVFVVDISESMKDSGLQQAKEAINEIIDWIEMVAKEEKMEENIGIVTFGHITQCRHHLTKDYESLRACIDGLRAAGSSPLYGGLDMALALFKHEGDATTLVCNHKISPRIVLLSDGQATDHHLLGGKDTQNSPVKPQTRDTVLTFARGLAERRVPVYCVPIGDHTDQSLLTDIATTTSGQVVSLDEVFRIGRHCSNLACVLRVRKILPPEGLDTTALKTVVKMTEKKFSEDDLEDMVAILGNPVFQQTVDKGFSFDDLQESNPQMPPIGSRVRQGPEWKWKNQDLDGVGTVIGHGKNGMIKVEWDCSNKGEYRYGNNQAFDVVVVEEPRLLKPDETIATGCVVCRGIDWEYDDQDGGFGQIGRVYHTEQAGGQVWVRWPNGHRGRYSYILDGKQDLVVCDPFAVHEIQAEQSIPVEAEEGATGGIFLRSGSSSLSESSSVQDLPHDDDQLEAASMSIYDMVPPSQGLLDDDEEEEEEEEEEERGMALSLVEAMNKRNESPQCLPPRRTGEPLSDQSRVEVKDTVRVNDTPFQVSPDHDTPICSSSLQPDTPVQVLPDQTILPDSLQVDVPNDTGYSVDDDNSNSPTSLSHQQDIKLITIGHVEGGSVSLCEGDEISHNRGHSDPNSSESVPLEAPEERSSQSINLGTPLSHSTPGPISFGSLGTPGSVASASIGTPVTGKPGSSESVSSDNLNFKKSKFSLTEQQTTYVSRPTTDLETSKVKMTFSPESPVLTQSPSGSPGSSFRGHTHPAGAGSIRNLSFSTSSVASTANTSSDTFNDTFSDTASVMSTSTVTSSDVVWQWEDEQRVWHAYSPEQNLKIEKTRKRSPRGTVVLSINGENYRVVMYKAIQIHTVSRATNNIRSMDKSSDVANLRDVEL